MSMPKRIAIVVVVLAVIGGVVWWSRRDHAADHYTGFVEGEERIIRSETTGRVLEVAFKEGSSVPAGAVLVRLDDADTAARVRAKEAEVAMIDAQIARQDEQVALTEATWERDRSARAAEVRRAEATASLAERTLAREEELVKTGASTRQTLDDQRAVRDQSRSDLQKARDMLGRADAEERSIALAKQQKDVLVQQRAMAAAQLGQLQVEQGKFTIRSPAVPTTVQTQLIWPGELAQPGTPIVSVLDPEDKYVQVYVPVPDVGRFRIGRPVEIELDSEPGKRFKGEVSFVADTANFTPEKIDTRSDRLGQVYREKIRILEGVERFQPGSEGNVWLVGEEQRA
jgi:HlyD family secretion protein